ncbi:hypothetical protein Hanom_Chr02g00160281 [Helianthus anomalus]
MEINMPCGTIELDEKDGAVKKWKDRFPERFVSPTKMVDTIETSDGDDNFNFRMDFLVCFVIVMIDCHKQGCLRPGILYHITCDLNFADIDWFPLMLDKMK